MDGEPSGVLYGGVYIPKISFQRVFSVERIGASSMEYQIHRAHRFVHAVGDGQPGLGDLTAWVWCTGADGSPSSADGINDVGTGGIQDGFGLGKSGLDEGAITQQRGRTR